MFLFLDQGLVYTQSDRLRTSALRIVIPTRRSFVVFLAIMTLTFLAINLFFHIDNWSHIYLLAFQPVRVPLYIGYFIFLAGTPNGAVGLKKGFQSRARPVGSGLSADRAGVTRLPLDGNRSQSAPHVDYRHPV
jgi:hypothetical protein